MRDELFSGFSETGWDKAPWEVEPVFTADELQILLNPALSATEAADRGTRRTTAAANGVKPSARTPQPGRWLEIFRGSARRVISCEVHLSVQTGEAPPGRLYVGLRPWETANNHPSERV